MSITTASPQSMTVDRYARDMSRDVAAIHSRSSRSRRTFTVIALFVAVGLSGCAFLTPTEASTENLRISAQEVNHFDGYCGVGVKIENVGSTPVTFTEDDREVFDGSSSLDWDLPFNDVKDGEIFGYIIGEFPTTIEPGSTATDAFVVNCDGNPFTITVRSVDGGTTTLEFYTDE